MHAGVELCNLLTVWLCMDIGCTVHDRLFDYEICSLLCLPCMPTKEMVVYGYVICSIEECGAMVYSFDSGLDKNQTIKGES